MEQFKHLDAKTIELAGIAVSLAGGCRPCLDYHFKKALEIGCTIEEAEEAVELVRKEVKDKYPETIDVKFYNVLLPENQDMMKYFGCLLYTSPSPRD